MGLLDGLLNDENSRFALGLLAAAGPTTDPNKTGFGARMQTALDSVDQWKQQQALAKRQAMQDQFMQFQMEQARAQAERQKNLQEGVGKFFKPGQPATPGTPGIAYNSPIDSMLPPELRVGTKATPGLPAQPPSVDTAGLADFLAKQGDYQTAMTLLAPKRTKLSKDEAVFDDATGKKVLDNPSVPDLPPLVREFQFAQANPEFTPWMLAGKRAGAPSSSVKIDMAGDTEYAKNQGKDWSETMSNINKAAFAAPAQLRKLERMTQLLDGVDGGKFAPMGTEIASALNSFGVKVDPKLGNKEASLALSREMAGNLRQPGTGPMTDKDFDNFLLQIPDLSKSAAGRKQITETMSRALARDIQVAKLARAYEKKNGRLDGGFSDEIAQFFAENPVVTLPQGYGVKR